ncbi:hypothetical protein HGP28_06860 [Vibrio sp. SM6]|uniref:Uncharacterized protein n=1 Tax=Vibrio agarilyticus TaxID=2726741 RepID=A0A7X8YG60_9VIBR|nr:hypothetical protein [Vibrio agarilyticus]NLS12623.1 hypothetical protein [Vibrio agarilyticus]
MLWETLERVNRLREQAMADPNFVKAAKAHEKAIAKQDNVVQPNIRRRKAKNKPRKLADIYEQTEFTHIGDHTQH